LTSPLFTGSSGTLIIKGDNSPAGETPLASGAIPVTCADAARGTGKTTTAIAAHKTKAITAVTALSKRLPFPAFVFRMFIPPVREYFLLDFTEYSVALLAHK
jgi:hypothetical protein